MPEETRDITEENTVPERLSFSLKAAGIGVWNLEISQTRRHSLEWDERCRELFGLAKDNTMPYEEAFSAVHPEDIEKVHAAILRAENPESGGGYDLKYRTIGIDDGILRMVHFIGQMYYDTDGLPCRFSGVAMDASHEIRLQEESLRLRTLIDDSPDMMTMASSEGEILVLNPAARELLGVAPGTDLKTLKSSDFYPSPETAQEIYRYLEATGSWTGTIVLRNLSTGELIPFTGNMQVVVNPQSGKVIGRSGFLKDLRPELRAQQALLDSEYKFRNVTNTSPTGLWLSDEHGGLTYLNKTLTDWTGMAYEDLLGTGWSMAVIEEDREKSTNAFLEAIAVLGHYDMEFRIRKADGNVLWCRAAGDPFYHDDGRYAGYAGFCMDIHERVSMTDSLREREEHIRNIVEQAPMGIGALTGPEFIIESANTTLLAVWGKDQSVMNQPLLQALPEIEGQGFIEILQGVYTTGEPFYGYEIPALLDYGGELKKVYFDFIYTPLRKRCGTISGILLLASDVTTQVMAKNALRESERRFRGLIEEAPVATCVFFGRELRIDIANDEMLKMWGKDSSVIGKPLSEGVPELVGQPFIQILQHIFETKETYVASEARANLVRDGVLGTYYFNFTYKPLLDEQGEVYAIMDMAIDVTAQVVSKHRMAESDARLKIAIETANLGTWEIYPEAGKLEASHRMKKWFGIDEGDELTLAEIADCISGPNAFEEAIRKAQQRENSGIIDVEYTIINRKNGLKYVLHTVGQTFFDEEGKAYLMTGSTKDITLQRNTEYKLENLVQKRTEQLQASKEALEATNDYLADTNEHLFRSNEELAQYAYVASHDLQEPLRKIRVFSDILSHQESLSEENKPIVDKISKASGRMSMLISDLLEFSRLLKTDKPVQQVALGIVIPEVINDFELVIAERDAVIRINGLLPELEAVPLQMNQLFYNLINNALKFTEAGKQPLIEISSKLLTSAEAKHFFPRTAGTCFHDITISDNGIGFEPQYAEQIFEVFKRLHGRDSYQGSGIGLALCKRIVVNHGGHLYAESTPGQGSVFHIILPAMDGGNS